MEIVSRALPMYRWLVAGTMAILLIRCVDRAEERANFIIAYNVAMDDEQSDYDIWTVDPVTRVHSNITNHPDVAWTYLAIDNKILFLSDRDTCTRCFRLYEMHADGSGVRKVSNLLLRDSWMSARAQGRELIVAPSSTIDTAFHILRRRDGQFIGRVEPPLPYCNDPVFSPGGQQIVFRGGKAKSKREQDFDEALYSIRSDGTNLIRLTHELSEDESTPWYAYRAGAPRWHPADNYISYQSFRDGKYSLFGVTPHGNSIGRLTDLPQQEGWHDWSKDGRWLAVEVFDPDQSQFHIGLMDWRTKDWQILTDTAFRYQQAPVFVYDQ